MSREWDRSLIGLILDLSEGTEMATTRSTERTDDDLSEVVELTVKLSRKQIGLLAFRQPAGVTATATDHAMNAVILAAQSFSENPPKEPSFVDIGLEYAQLIRVVANVFGCEDTDAPGLIASMAREGWTWMKEEA